MKRKKWLTLMLIVAVFVLLSRALSYAVWDPGEAVNIDPAAIENSTLIIGSHLIYVGVLTDTLYDVAMTSANDSGQNRIYYKSELAEGVWFDIATADTLKDITTAGTPVDNDTIAALLLTHHTRSDGITYDLRSGAAVNIFDIRSPYDLESMDELLPLKTQYDLAMELQKDSEFGQRKIALMTDFFRTTIHNSVTRDCDESLAALQRYYLVLSDNEGGAAEMEAVQVVMNALDAARRAEVMSILDGALNTLSRQLQAVEDTPGTKNENGDEEGGSTGTGADPNLQSAVNDSISNILESYLSYSGNMLAEGVSVMSSARYAACLSLISNGKSNNHAACDEDIAIIIALDNIQDSMVADKTKELDLLDSLLLPQATALYEAALNSGENAEYRAAVAQNAASALKNGIVQRAKNEWTVLRGELEFFIEARCLRLAVDSAMYYTGQRLERAGELLTALPRDGFEAAARESADAHIDFLSRLKRSLELQAGGNDADKLAAEKAALQQELLQALDNNDLAAAQTIEQRITAIDDALSLLAADSGTLAGLVSDLTAGAKSLIGEGEGSDELLSLIDALGALLESNYQLTFSALEELYNAMTLKRILEDNSSFNEAIAAVEQILLDNEAAYNAAMLGTLNQSGAEAIAEQFFGGGTGLFDSGSPPGGQQSGAGGGSSAGGGETGAGLTDGLTGQAIELAAGAKQMIAGEQDAGALLDCIEALGGLYGANQQLVGSILEDLLGDIMGKIDEGGETPFVQAAAAIEEILLTPPVRSGMGEPPGGAAADGLLTGTVDVSGLSGHEKEAIFILALNMYGEATGSSDLDGLMRSKTQRQAEVGNVLVYQAVQDTASRYLPAQNIAQYNKWRYIWSANNSEATLARGGAYYTFRAYAAEVSIGQDRSSVSYMTLPSRYLQGLQLPESFTHETFGLWAAYIPGTPYGVMVSQRLYDLAVELFTLLLRAESA